MVRRPKPRGRSRRQPLVSAAPSPTELLIDLACEWRASEEPLRRLLARRSDRLRSLHSHHRQGISDLLFAYARLRRRVDAVADRMLAELPVTSARPSPRRRVRWSLAAVERAVRDGSAAEIGVEILGQLPGVALEDVEDAALTRATEGGRAVHDPLAPLGERWAFPDDVVRELTRRLPPGEIEAALLALNHRAPMVLRAASVEGAAQLVDDLRGADVPATLHPLVPGAVVVDPPRRLDRHSATQRAGAVVQDAASQLAVLALDLSPGQRVIDYCAGGGVKAEAIASHLAGSGQLVMLDIDERRLSRARRRVARSRGLTVLAVTHDGASEAPERYRGWADRVLADLPCSGLGTVRRHPDLKWRYGPEEVRNFGRLQRALATNAASCLRPGGRLVYATCSLRRTENEEVVAAISSTTGLREVPLQAALGPLAERLGAEGGQLTLWPHRHRCDGFFIAVLERPGESLDPRGEAKGL